jgi:hypothetical protein
MAAGSKYWQVRWERAAKTTEIWLIEALKNEPRISHFFTADGNDLHADELAKLTQINLEPNRQADPLTMGAGAGRDANERELKLGAPGTAKRFWNWVILKKFSVSRIPIYVGATLAAFWFFLLTLTVNYDGGNIWHLISPWCVFEHFSLVPFKAG